MYENPEETDGPILPPVQTAATTQGQPEEKPKVAEDIRRLVGEWMGKIKAAEKHHTKSFEAMRRSMSWATHGCDKSWKASGAYVANITNRYVNRKVAELYAKNPTVVIKREEQIDGDLWDGTAQGLNDAIGALQMGDPILAPAAMQILAEAQQVMAMRAATDKFAKTLRLVIQRSWGRAFKSALKQAVRRAIICKVGWIWFDVFTETGMDPVIEAQISDTRTRLAALEKLQDDAARAAQDDELAPKVTQLRLALDDMMQAGNIVLQEGIIYDWPRSDQVLVDPGCTQLRGFLGARWIARVWDLTPEKIEAIYQVKLYATAPTAHGEEQKQAANAAGCKTMRVYRVYDRDLQQTFDVCDGFEGFLREPAPPPVYRKGFWPCIPVMFNESELPEGEIYPPSHVELLMQPQDELNRARQGVRLHRQANRPIYVAPKTAFDKEDLTTFMSVPTHGIAFLKGLQQGTKILDLLQPVPKMPMEPELYGIDGIMYDFQLIGGFQEANLGPAVGTTATESTIAEQSRSTETGEDVDSLDDTLSELASEVGLMAVSALELKTVQAIAGEFAVWPEMSREELAEGLNIGIRAGSSGRPNKAMELANIERVAPLLQVIPGINPAWLAQRVLERLEDDLDLQEALSPSLPSITALNALAGRPAAPPGGAGAADGGGGEGNPGAEQPPADGNPTAAPSAQGAEGQNPVPAAPGRPGGPQPAFGSSGNLVGA